MRGSGKNPIIRLVQQIAALLALALFIDYGANAAAQYLPLSEVGEGVIGAMLLAAIFVAVVF